MKQINLTEGPLRSSIVLYSLPLCFSNLLQVAFNMCDIAVVGRFAGSLALGAVGSTPMVLFFVIGILQGLASGVNVIAAYHAGAKQKKDLDETVHTSAILCLVAGLFMMLLGIVCGRPVLELLRTRPELIEGALRYFKIYMIGMPAMAMYNYGNGLLSAIGDTKRPLYYLSFSGGLNVILNLVFVILFKMNVGGVAWASVISQYAAAFLILRRLFIGTGDIKLSLDKLKLSPLKAKKIIEIGLPSGLQNSIFAFANMFIQVGINSFSPAAVAGISAAAEADPIVYNVMAAFYSACASFIGQNFGARKKDRVIKTFNICCWYPFFIALVMGAVLFVFGRQFLSLFSTDAEVIEAGLLRLKIMSWSYCISAFMDNPIAACRGLGKTLFPSVVVVVGSCVFRIFWVLVIFGHFKTVESLFLLFACSWTMTGIAEIIYFFIIYKKEFGKNKTAFLV